MSKASNASCALPALPLLSPLLFLSVCPLGGRPPVGASNEEGLNSSRSASFDGRSALFPWSASF